jgi:hypothetical protein
MLRIKRFISHHRKPPILDSSRNSFEDLRFTDTKLSTNSAKRLSWISQTASFENTPLRRTNSQATARTSTFPTASTTAHSSVTSLCSCDCAANAASVQLPLSGEPAASNLPEILYLPPLSPRKTSSDAETWRLIFSESPTRSPTPNIPKPGREVQSTAIIAAGSTFDLIGELALEVPDEVKTPTQNLKNTCDSGMGDFPDDVEQLIRETDAAFQAVGNALADARAATRGWYDNDVPVARNTSLTRGILKKNPRSSEKPPKFQAPRSMSVGKKKKPPNRNLLGQVLRSGPQPIEKTPSRWTLNDVTANVVDVFSGKIFRTEVDEMLTPDRLLQLQESHRLSQEHRLSVDSARGAETDEDTPTEPFHLQSLSNRLDAAQRNAPPFPSPILPPPATPQHTAQPPNRPARPKLPRKVQLTDPSVKRENETEMTINELTFPSPPRISRRPSASGNVLHLPTIPEISPLRLSPAELFTSVPSILQPTLSKPKPRSEGGFIFLPCTEFTLTSPLFRHGTIRVPVAYREPKFCPGEESLDWTAFQMAISGTGGIDGYADSYERGEIEQMELKQMEREADDIMDWWAEFGFQGCGNMCGDESLRVPGSQQKGLTRKKRRDDIERASVLEAQVSPRHSEYLKKIVDKEKIVVADNSGFLSANEEPLRGSVAESLPPSPMLDFVLPSPSKDSEVIPMGFNLGHDLGDFLRWETNHVQTLFVE